MSKSDYNRPADYQIYDIYRCDRCHKNIEQVSIYGINERCDCGGTIQHYGQSYPASADDWDEKRDDTNSEWHRKR